MRLFNNYQWKEQGFDEIFIKPSIPRAQSALFYHYFNQFDVKTFSKNHQLANEFHRENGVTFNVIKDDNSLQENIFPFDLIPRIILHDEWKKLERGLIQRVEALNLFLCDIYGKQKILTQRSKKNHLSKMDQGTSKLINISRKLIETSLGYCPLARGLKPLEDIYIHIAGIDLIRDETGEFVVLEDNLRTPSGVAYVLENRKVSESIFSEVFSEMPIAAVEAYPEKLIEVFNSLAPQPGLTVLLSPGPYNGAYFEHCYLAEKLNCPLVEGQDLYVKNNKVYLKKTRKNHLKDESVSVIYRRIDDNYLDPLSFKKDSVIGVPGLFNAYQTGNVAIVNAIGNGIADDKALYPFVPDIIRYYLEEEPILKQIPTYSCLNPEELQFILDNIETLVIKNTNTSGGQEVYIGKHLSSLERQHLVKLILENRRYYIAQPLINFSFSPTFIENGLEPRRSDFRPYIIQGESFYVMPGGLTRVALKKDGYIVNSCQGGGSKDTWVISEDL